MKMLLLVSLFVFSGCADVVRAHNECPLSREHIALAQCLNSWDCDKSPKDVERLLELKEADSECLSKSYERQAYEREQGIK